MHATSFGSNVACEKKSGESSLSAWQADMVGSAMGQLKLGVRTSARIVLSHWQDVTAI